MDQTHSLFLLFRDVEGLRRSDALAATSRVWRDALMDSRGFGLELLLISQTYPHWPLAQ